MTTKSHRLGNRSAKGDVGTPAGADEHVDLRLWLRLMTIHKLVKNEIGRCLRREFAATLPRFDLMSQLRRNPHGIRMVELSKRLMVTTGNITAITDQLEKEGMVQRKVDPSNRSAFLIKATPRGERSFDSMAVEHTRWLIRLFTGLTLREKKNLIALLDKQKAHLNRGANRADA